MEASNSSFQQINQLLLSEIHQVGKILERLREANSTNLILEDWHEDMLHHFAAEVGLNIARMLMLLEHKQQNLPTLAYVVRNLLELNVWIEYCCKSKENAQHFYQDKWRDGVGFKNAINSLVRAVPTVPNASEIERALDSFENTLQQTATAAGLLPLDDDYKRVVEAADELGFRTVFIGLNTLLSKFAHPTAMTVLTFIESETLDQVFGVFLIIGVALAITGCRTVTEHIKGLKIVV